MIGRAPNGTNVRRSGLLTIEVVLMHAASAVVGGTGIVYAWFRYFATPADPYAVVASRWQPLVQHLHVLVAPALVFAAGAFWRSHALATWRKSGTGRRRSGLFLVLSTVPMVASGYLVQVAVEDSWRRGWGIVHTVVSVAWIAGSVIHLVVRRGRPSSDGSGAPESRFRASANHGAASTKSLPRTQSLVTRASSSGSPNETINS